MLVLDAFVMDLLIVLFIDGLIDYIGFSVLYWIKRHGVFLKMAIPKI